MSQLGVAAASIACGLLASSGSTQTPPPPRAASATVDLALIEDTGSRDPAPGTIEFGSRMYAIGESRTVRVLSADSETMRPYEGVRLTFEPHDAAEFRKWTQRNVHAELAWFRRGEIVSVTDIDGAADDGVVFWGIRGEDREALVAEIGATRDVPLAKEYGEPLDASSWIELERKPCAQRCSAYTLRVGGDGAVVYRGAAGVAQVGEHNGTVSAIVVRRLFVRTAAAEWLALPDVAATPSDATAVTLHVGDKTKRVANGASALVDVLATAIDMETRSRQWTGRLDAASRSSIARARDYTPKDPNDFEIRLKRTPCFGRCPVYTVVIHGDGSVEYTGGADVAVMGTAKKTISRDTIDDLLDRLQEHAFWQLKDVYDSHTTDIPSTKIALRIGDRAKEVLNRWSGHERGKIPDRDIHRALDEIALAIDVAVDSESWIRKP